MRTFAIPLAAVASLVAVAVVLMTFSAPPAPTQASQHDADLRDCHNRYAISSPYAEAEFRRWGLEMVAACMRGRGY